MIFDSHAHYNDSKFNDDRDEVLKNLDNVKYIMNVADSMKSLKKVINIADKYPFIYASVGVHPEETGELTSVDMDTLLEYTKHKKVKAIGEIGLDYYWDSVERDIQKKWFARQIELARKVNLPIIVHDREAHGDTIDILKSENARDVGGILHCFSGSVEMARDVLNLGMYVGIGGTVTFKNARKIKEVAEYVPMDSIVLETDAPYLAPEPFRGKRNSSDLIKYVIEEISRIKGIPKEEVEKITFENAKRVYRIED
ncbi:MAG: TatD family hydrolase [Clostridia bacterium]|nr:TatD family hydrolase [Clostridia bacterium]